MLLHLYQLHNIIIFTALKVAILTSKTPLYTYITIFVIKLKQLTKSKGDIDLKIVNYWVFRWKTTLQSVALLMRMSKHVL